jgi:1-aminocyclopropane-1-carboxylate deaminase/D-cysteine desulfhydrase-like pyridoxal-dependent ACC family enzyme
LYDGDELTPVERRGDWWLKRDDLFSVAGIFGGKVRTCHNLVTRAVELGFCELVTAGSRHSPQCHIVAALGNAVGLTVTVHVPAGELGAEITAAQALGAQVQQHRPGYNSVIVARAKAYAAEPGRFYIPFGMVCPEAVTATAGQVASIPDTIRRIVMPIGSGMSAAGVVAGLLERNHPATVMGVQVGADPIKRLDEYAPMNWRSVLTIVKSPMEYSQSCDGVAVDGVALDPIYEAKCVPFLQAGDLLWLVGHRGNGAPVDAGGSRTVSVAVPVAVESAPYVPLDDRDPDEAPAVWRLFTELDDWDENPRDNDGAAEVVADLIVLYGFAAPLSAWPDPDRDGRERLIAGHTRKKAMFILAKRYAAAGQEERSTWHPGAIQAVRTGRVPVRIRADLTRTQANELALADNKASELATWDQSKLSGLLKHLPDGRALQLGWDQSELSRLLGGSAPDTDANVERATTTLAERFTVPPFTVLDARQGYWKDRKKAWIDLGLKSYLGRENTATFVPESGTKTRPPKPPKGILPSARRVDGDGNRVRVGAAGMVTQGDALGQPLDTSEIQTTLSIFDPVLAELAYRWFGHVGAAVLDPFAGGSVRGLVAQRLGLRYCGIDLRPEQVEANQYQANQIGHRFRSDQGGVEWVAADSSTYLADPHNGPNNVDLIFSCPPYMDLETYSDDPRDISVMGAEAFWAVYRDIIAKSCARLANNRFAVWVIGEVRDARSKSGAYRGFVPGTIQAFADAGLSYYNEAILVTSLNSVPLRAAKHFIAGRKLCRTHQTVLVFLKGDMKKAVESCGDISNCVPDDLTQYVDGGTDGD